MISIVWQFRNMPTPKQQIIWYKNLRIGLTLYNLISWINDVKCFILFIMFILQKPNVSTQIKLAMQARIFFFEDTVCQ